MARLHHTIKTCHNGDVNWVAFSSNALATCSGDKTVRVWSTNDWTELSFSPLLGHSYYVHCCCFSPFGTILASCSTDGKAILWDMKTGNKLAAFEHPSKGILRVCCFSPESGLLATGGADNLICLWKHSDRKLIGCLEGHQNTVTACCFTPDSAYLASGSADGDIRVWDVRQSRPPTLPAAAIGRCMYYLGSDCHELGVSCIAFSPTFGSADAALADTLEGVRYFLMASCGADNLVKLWNLNTEPDCFLKLRCVLEGHTAKVMSCAFTLDGKRLASGAVDKVVILWDPITGERLQILEGHTRYVTSCAFSFDGEYMASGSNDKTVCIWSLNSSGSGPSQGNSAETGIKEVANVKSRNSLPAILLSGKKLDDWSVQDVCDWLLDLGLDQYVPTFHENEIDGQELSHLTAESLANDLNITALGNRNKILRGIEIIKEQCNLRFPTAPPLPLLDSDVHDEFLCPITREIMKDPVIASDGYTYERTSIEAWLQGGRSTSPMTNAPLPNNALTPNRSLKMLIERHSNPPDS